MTNIRQKRFIAEYLIDLNATQAAIRAGYSAKAARTQGARLMSDDDIRMEIAEAQEKAASRLQITAERVLHEIARVAFADLRSLFDQDGRLKPIHRLSADERAQLASIEHVVRPGPAGEEQVVKVKCWDKLKALELLGRHLGMFNDKVTLDVTSSLASRMEAARRRRLMVTAK